jgi:hypothetical protein
MRYMQAWCKVRFNFTIIDSRYYAGGRTDPSIILSDIERKLPPHIKKSQYRKDKSSPKVSAEYSITYDDSDLPKQEKEGSFARFLAKDPYEELLEDDIELVKDLIKKTYGVSKDENNKIEYKIISEGPNLIKV